MRHALELLRSAHFTPALPWGAAVAQIGAENGLNFANARARSGFARGHLLDIVVYLPGGSGTAREAEAAEELVRLLVGEEIFERWVGSVSVTPTARRGPLTVLGNNAEEHSALPLDMLPDTLNAAIAGLKLGLPQLLASTASDSEDWVLFELEPDPAPDYAAQDDLAICSTRTPELKKSFLRGEPFFSSRFTNSAALFTYLKYESVRAAPEARLAERARFEEVVVRALRPEQGVVVGLGLGLRYGYIDLALGDPECVRERLLPALRAAGITERSWLLFCDSELEHEHIPLYLTSPAPYTSRC